MPKGPLTEAEREERRQQIETLNTESNDLLAQAADLEKQAREKIFNVPRMRHEIRHAELLDDPLICDQRRGTGSEGL